MLTNSQQLEFRRYLSKWLDFSTSRTEENLDRLKEHIFWLYAEMDLPEPQIVECLGPIEQIILPPLIRLLLQLGYDKASQTQFQRMAEPAAVTTEWSNLWLKALNAIDWKKAQDMSATAVLNGRIERRLDKDTRHSVTAHLDQEMGFEFHQELESLCNHQLEVPYQNLRRVLSFNRHEQANIWRSLLNRSPANAEKILKGNLKPGVPGWYSKSGPALINWMGGWDWYWLASADFGRDKLSNKFGRKLERQLDVWTDLALNATSYLFGEGFCFIYFRPREFHFDQDWRLHHDQRAAVDFVDGTRFYFWHGVEVEEHLIMHPEKIKIKTIESEPNVEIRRIMIERYGLEHYIRASGARKIQEDEYGELYVKHVADDEPLTVVKVLNSTPEPDGTVKTYLLRVPPGTETAREGIAWTFGMKESDYVLDEES